MFPNKCATRNVPPAILETVSGDPEGAVRSCALDARRFAARFVDIKYNLGSNKKCNQGSIPQETEQFIHQPFDA